MHVAKQVHGVMLVLSSNEVYASSRHSFIACQGANHSLLAMLRWIRKFACHDIQHNYTFQMTSVWTLNKWAKSENATASITNEGGESENV